jgi:hypothetical protein
MDQQQPPHDNQQEQPTEPAPAEEQAMEQAQDAEERETERGYQ